MAEKGLRATRQRQVVFSVIMDKRDHPTVDDVFSRCKAIMPSISLATVYNCLETLVDCKLVRQVNFDRQPTRFCPNVVPHAHFHCKETGKVFDVPLSPEAFDSLSKNLPKGCDIDSIDILVHGTSSHSLN